MIVAKVKKKLLPQTGGGWKRTAAGRLVRPAHAYRLPGHTSLEPAAAIGRSVPRVADRRAGGHA
jgi:hypothetical protein